MAIEDIINIVGTVAVVQFVCDVSSNYFVYDGDQYQRLLGRLRRAQYACQKEESKLDQENLAGKRNISSTGIILSDKQQRKWQKAKADAAQAASDVAARRTWPTIVTSLVFFLLYRIFATEYNGKVMAVLPFTPWNFLHRFMTITTTTSPLDASAAITTTTTTIAAMSPSSWDPSRGVTSVHQGCSFFFIYVLCTMSIKFYVNKIFGTPPPPNITFASLVDAPSSQKILKQFQLDNESMRSKMD